MGVAVDFQEVCIVFGDKPQTALPLMDAGQDRADLGGNRDHRQAGVDSSGD